MVVLPALGAAIHLGNDRKLGALAHQPGAAEHPTGDSAAVPYPSLETQRPSETESATKGVADVRMFKRSLAAGMAQGPGSGTLVVDKGQRAGSQTSTQRVDALIRMGSEMSEEKWLKVGPEALQTLRSKSFKSNAIKSKVNSICRSDSECAFRQENSVFCQLLEYAGRKGDLGDVSTLENIMNATLQSTWFYGLDTDSQGALIARWDKADHWKPPLHSQGLPHGKEAVQFLAMQSRVVHGKPFAALIDDTCADLETVRPSCRIIANVSLFCQALGQAATVSIGAYEANRGLERALREMA